MHSVQMANRRPYDVSGTEEIVLTESSGMPHHKKDSDKIVLKLNGDRFVTIRQNRKPKIALEKCRTDMSEWYIITRNNWDQEVEQFYTYIKSAHERYQHFYFIKNGTSFGIKRYPFPPTCMEDRRVFLLHTQGSRLCLEPYMGRGFGRFLYHNEMKDKLFFHKKSEHQSPTTFPLELFPTGEDVVDGGPTQPGSDDETNWPSDRTHADNESLCCIIL